MQADAAFTHLDRFFQDVEALEGELREVERLHHARTSVVVGLRKKLRDAVDVFAELRRLVADQYQETVAREMWWWTLRGGLRGAAVGWWMLRGGLSLDGDVEACRVICSLPPPPTTLPPPETGQTAASNKFFSLPSRGATSSPLLLLLRLDLSRSRSFLVPLSRSLDVSGISILPSSSAEPKPDSESMAVISLSSHPLPPPPSFPSSSSSVIPVRER